MPYSVVYVCTACVTIFIPAASGLQRTSVPYRCLKRAVWTAFEESRHVSGTSSALSTPHPLNLSHKVDRSGFSTFRQSQRFTINDMFPLNSSPPRPAQTGQPVLSNHDVSQNYSGAPALPRFPDIRATLPPQSQQHTASHPATASSLSRSKAQEGRRLFAHGPAWRPRAREHI